MPRTASTESARRLGERRGSSPTHLCGRRDGPRRRFLAHHLALPPGTDPSGWRFGIPSGLPDAPIRISFGPVGWVLQEKLSTSSGPPK
jgi:hypothetical protein